MQKLFLHLVIRCYNTKLLVTDTPFFRIYFLQLTFCWKCVQFFTYNIIIKTSLRISIQLLIMISILKRVILKIQFFSL